MSVINTNIKALQANNAMVANNRTMTTTMQQLSTGQRINSAGDDAAGLAVVSKMTAQIRGLDQAVRNANDGIALLQTAEGAMIEQTNMMQRMRELAIQSANDTNTSDDRAYLDLEFQELKKEINRIGSNTQWNGMNILDSSFKGGTGDFVFQVGANANQIISRTLGDFSTTGSAAGTATVGTTAATTITAQESVLTIGGTFVAGDVISVNVGQASIQYTVKESDISNFGTTTAEVAADTHENIAASLAAAIGGAPGISVAVDSADAEKINFTASAVNTPFEISTSVGGLLGNIDKSEILTKVKSNAAVNALDVSLKTVNGARAEIGSTINRLNYAADNLSNVSVNTSAARSQVLDTDYAKATTDLARAQIIQQAGTAMLAQANQQPFLVLSLLQ
jgi:flagellin